MIILSATVTISVKFFFVSFGTPSRCLFHWPIFVLNWSLGLKFHDTRPFVSDKPFSTAWTSEHVCGFSSWQKIDVWHPHLSSVHVWSSPYSSFSRISTWCSTCSFIVTLPWRRPCRSRWSPSRSGLWVPSFLTITPTDTILEFNVDVILRVVEVDVLIHSIWSHTYKDLRFDVVYQGSYSYYDTLGSALSSLSWLLLRRTLRTLWNWDNKRLVSSPLVHPITRLSDSFSTNWRIADWTNFGIASMTAASVPTLLHNYLMSSRSISSIGFSVQSRLPWRSDATTLMKDIILYLQSIHPNINDVREDLDLPMTPTSTSENCRFATEDDAVDAPSQHGLQDWSLPFVTSKSDSSYWPDSRRSCTVQSRHKLIWIINVRNSTVTIAVEDGG